MFYAPTLISFCNLLSAVDNYFFQRERNKILNSQDDDGNNKSFQEIGRVIGQRWREIKPEEVSHMNISLFVTLSSLTLCSQQLNHDVQLALFDEMAKEDRVRYQRDMEIFYKEELALMCSGNAGDSSPDEGDKKPSAAETSTLSAAPSLASLDFSSMSIEQIAQLLHTLQQQGYESVNKEDVITGVNAEKANIRQRLLAILQESNDLQKKYLLLEQLGNSVVLSEPRLALAQSAFPGVFGLDNLLFGRPGFGQLSLSDGALLKQLVSSQQLQQQLGGGLSAAATASLAMPQVANQNPTPAPGLSATQQLPTFGNATNQTQQPSTEINYNATSLSSPLAAAAAQPSSSFGLAGLASVSQQTNLHDALLLKQYLEQLHGSASAPSADPKPPQKDESAER